ncbi:MAG: hypothetical protein OXG15_07110, partial [Gammaproteobacteria bacterium]|nr:hypothetical protein [Gammaproteobacteria bacterium]
MKKQTVTAVLLTLCLGLTLYNNLELTTAKSELKSLRHNFTNFQNTYSQDLEKQRKKPLWQKAIRTALTIVW